jgi:hypothetical protein
MTPRSASVRLVAWPSSRLEPGRIAALALCTESGSPALTDRVDDNDYKFDEGESESLVAGENFGIVTNIVNGPDGDLYVTSLTNGAVYKISKTS